MAFWPYFLAMVCLGLIFFAVRLEKLGPGFWLIVFIATILFDLISTLVATHLYGWPWAKEGNVVIQYLGPYCGYDLAVLLHFVLLSAAALFFFDLSQRRSKLFREMVSLCFFLISCLRIEAGVHNLLLPL